MITPSTPPSKAENDAWWSYKTVCQKQGRETDERTFRDGWRQGARFTFSATSVLSPAIAAFIEWMQYISDWSPPGDWGNGSPPGDDGTEAQEPTQARS